MEEKELKIEEKDINKNIRFFLIFAYTTRIIGLGIASLGVFISIIGIISNIAIIISGNNPNFIEVLTLLASSVLCALLGFICEAILKWMAYMLYTNKKRK